MTYDMLQEYKVNYLVHKHVEQDPQAMGTLVLRTDLTCRIRWLHHVDAQQQQARFQVFPEDSRKN